MSAQATIQNGKTTAVPAQPAAAPSFGEAPASATVDAISPSGRRWLLTTRAATVGELMQRVEYLDKWLSDHDWTARPAQAQAAGQAEPPPLCAIHKTPMTRRTKDGRSWWSCNEKLDTGEWCPYRPKS